MIEIKNFFDKFLKIQNNHSFLKEVISEAILGVTKIKIDKNKIDIRDNSIYLDCKPIYRNEIFMNMEKIKKILEIKNIHKKLN